MQNEKVMFVLSLFVIVGLSTYLQIKYPGPAAVHEHVSPQTWDQAFSVDWEPLDGVMEHGGGDPAPTGEPTGCGDDHGEKDDC